MCTECAGFQMVALDPGDCCGLGKSGRHRTAHLSLSECVVTEGKEERPPAILRVFISDHCRKYPFQSCWLPALAQPVAPSTQHDQGEASWHGIWLSFWGWVQKLQIYVTLWPWRAGLTTAFLSSWTWATTNTEGGRSSLLIQPAVCTLRPRPYSGIWTPPLGAYQRPSQNNPMGYLPAEDTATAQRLGKLLRLHPMKTSRWEFISREFRLGLVELSGEPWYFHQEAPPWYLSLLPLHFFPLSPYFSSLAFGCDFLWRKKLFCPRKLIYSKISERSGHPALCGAHFQVIAFVHLHLARWSLEALCTDITPGFSWKGKDFSFSSSGPHCYYWSQALAWDQSGVGVGSWIWKPSQRRGKRKPCNGCPSWPVRADLQPDQPGEG